MDSASVQFLPNMHEMYCKCFLGHDTMVIPCCSLKHLGIIHKWTNTINHKEKLKVRVIIKDRTFFFYIIFFTKKKKKSFTLIHELLCCCFLYLSLGLHYIFFTLNTFGVELNTQ